MQSAAVVVLAGIIGVAGVRLCLQGTARAEKPPIQIDHRSSKTTVAASSSGVIHLGATPVLIRLEWIQASLKTPIRPESGRAYLVLRGIRAAEPPNVLYHVSLNLQSTGLLSISPGQTMKQVGVINFFDALIPQGFSSARMGSRVIRSFDVTSLVQGSLKPSDKLTVAIAPSGTPTANSQPEIDEIKLIIESH